MKVRLKIRNKLLLSVLLIALITYAISIGYLIVKLQNNSLRDSYEKADLNANSAANLVRVELNHDMDLSRSMVHAMYNFRKMPQKQRVSVFKDLIYGIAKENPNILSVWGSWEISALDSTYNKPYGRHRFTIYRENDELRYQEATLNLDGDDIGSSYYSIKLSKTEEMINPYWFSYTDESEQILEASTGVPLLENDEFKGLFGFDLPLERYQTISNTIRPFEGSYAIMLSNDGTIVGHPDKSVLGDNFSKRFSKVDKDNNLTTKVLSGDDFSFTMVDSISGDEFYATFAAIPIGKTKTPWSFGVIVPTYVLQREAKLITKNSLVISFLGLIVLAGIVWLMAYNITAPLIKAKNILGELAQGRIDAHKKIDLNTGDEVEDISHSVNTLIEGLSKTSEFALEIGKGNLNQHYTRLSDGDILGESLLVMQKSLQHAHEQENIRRSVDEKISWATMGMAKFAQILRENNDNIEEFSYQLISSLVRYVESNVGVLFILNEDNQNDIHFELVAAYAYERRKYIEKRIEIGEGLIGRCAQENETIFMTEIPDSYIKISSGLGNENPSSLLIVPLKLNDVVYGVIELASLEPIEQHKIDFVEKIGENIAATISTVKANMKTVKLLEESKIKSEELASQEEEMRQNMEELQATQEESARKTAEMESLINALHASSYVVEYDTKGKITSVNDAYIKLTNQTADQLIGTHHSDNLMLDEKQLREYNLFWDNLRSGIIKKETSKLKIGEKVFTFIETYSPIFNENNQVIKVLKIAQNITDFIGQEESGEKARPPME